MIAMAKKKTERSPFWAIFARVDPELKPAWELYCKEFEEKHGQTPEIGAFVQTLIKNKLKSTGHYPAPQDAE